ncbi:chaperone modulator CbpM [Thalassobaculum sp.]|uniref:chaperone modulator CbpM n=1 Tax=Thalassobaculum sp. TaxID=2022740 RepID=UPI0032EEEB58
MLDVTAVVARVRGLSEERLLLWVDEGLVCPDVRQGGLVFAEVDVARLRLLVTLEAELGVEPDTVPVVVDLLDQIHGLRRALRTLGEAVARQPEPVRAEIRAALTVLRDADSPDAGGEQER